MNGAILSKRLEAFLVMHLGMMFTYVYHLVDSSTVLGNLQIQDAKMKPFEGIHVSEMETGVFPEGRLHNLELVDGEKNPADRATKPRPVSDLMGGFGRRDLNSFLRRWRNGPSEGTSRLGIWKGRWWLKRFTWSKIFWRNFRTIHCSNFFPGAEVQRSMSE